MFPPLVVSLINHVNLHSRIECDKAKYMICNWINLKIEVPKFMWLFWLIGLRIWIGNHLLVSIFSKLFVVHSLFGLIITIVVNLWMENALTHLLSLYLYSLIFIY
ncbi:hypothetical protein RYX36_022939 [Vicia faba]